MVLYISFRWFFIGVIIPLFWLISAMFTGDIKHAAILMIVLIPFGFSGFIRSFKAPSFCKRCGGRLDTFWSNEVRANGRYSGTISVCKQCRKYEARITYDFEG